MNEDVLVYLDRDGVHYIGVWAEACWRGPAIESGWTVRRAATSSQAADAVELPQDLARLALRLSGVRVEDVA